MYKICIKLIKLDRPNLTLSIGEIYVQNSIVRTGYNLLHSMYYWLTIDLKNTIFYSDLNYRCKFYFVYCYLY